MTVETRVKKLEARMETLAERVDSHDDKIDQVLRAVVDMHEDLRRLEANLPGIIARAVAPLLARRED